MSKVAVEFGANDSGLDTTIKKIGKSLDGLDQNAKKAGVSVESSFSGMVKAGAALAIGFGAIKAAAALVSGTLGTFKDALDLGGTLADMSARTGIAIKDLVVLGRAFENAGKSADDLVKHLTGFGLIAPCKKLVAHDPQQHRTQVFRLRGVGELGDIFCAVLGLALHGRDL